VAVAFFVVFAGVGVLGALFFLLDGDVERKRRYYGPFQVGMGALFVGGMLAFDPSVGMAAVGIPAVAVITWLNLRNTRFCPSCGRTNYTELFWARPRYCSACGASLDVA
jgi:hypothetical protein